MRILSINVGHPATILPVKVGLGHTPSRASMGHRSRWNIAVVTELLQTGLSHPLLLVARRHLLYHHGCILTLLQRLLFRAWMLQGSGWEAFTHRWSEVSRQAWIGRGGKVIIHATAPPFPTLCMWKVKSRPFCHVHIRRVKVLQPLIWGLLRGRGSGLLHIKHGVPIGV